MITNNSVKLGMRLLAFLSAAIMTVSVSGCRHQEEVDPLDEQISQLKSSLTRTSELGTVEYTVSKVIKASDVAWYKYGDRKIIFSCTAYLKAGIDMRSFNMENLKIDKENKTVSIVLPKAKLLSINLPPESIQTEYNNISGFRQEFSPTERLDLKRQGEKSIRAEVGQYGLLESAQDNAREFFKAIFTQLGFEAVSVTFKN